MRLSRLQGRQRKDRVGAAGAMSPSIRATVMWLWAVLVLCHYIHNACCFPQHTRSITPMRTLPRAYLHMHKRDGLAGEGHQIQAAAIDCWEISSVYHMCVCDAHCVLFQPPLCWMSWTGRRLWRRCSRRTGKKTPPFSGRCLAARRAWPATTQVPERKLSAWFNLRETSQWIVAPSSCAFLVPSLLAPPY